MQRIVNFLLPENLQHLFRTKCVSLDCVVCIRHRRETHVIPNLVRGNKVVSMHWGCGPRPLLRDWFREDGLCGQNLNMVLTITAINGSYIIMFLIRSQINNYKSLGRNSIDYLMLCRQINFWLVSKS
jgi:hypothetical protein